MKEKVDKDTVLIGKGVASVSIFTPNGIYSLSARLVISDGTGCHMATKDGTVELTSLKNIEDEYGLETGSKIVQSMPLIERTYILEDGQWYGEVTGDGYW